MKRSARAGLSALLGLSLSLSAVAQSYPAKPVRIIAAGPLGGPSDMPARGIGYFLGAVGLEPGTMGGKPVAQFAAFLKVQRDRASRLAKELNIQPE